MDNKEDMVSVSQHWVQPHNYKNKFKYKSVEQKFKKRFKPFIFYAYIRYKQLNVSSILVGT